MVLSAAPLAIIAWPAIVSGKVPLSGQLVFCTLADLAITAKKDAKEIKEPAESLLLDNEVIVSKFLKKIDFSKMDLQKSDEAEFGPMRKGLFLTVGRSKRTICLPVNTPKTRKHLEKVFGSSPEIGNQLSEIINYPDNFADCQNIQNIQNTEGARFSVEGWRNILALWRCQSE